MNNVFKKNLIFFILIIASLAVVSGCGRKEETHPLPLSRGELATSSSEIAETATSSSEIATSTEEVDTSELNVYDDKSKRLSTFKEIRIKIQDFCYNSIENGIQYKLYKVLPNNIAINTVLEFEYKKYPEIKLRAKVYRQDDYFCVTLAWPEQVEWQDRENLSENFNIYSIIKEPPDFIKLEIKSTVIKDTNGDLIFNIKGTNEMAVMLDYSVIKSGKYEESVAKKDYLFSHEIKLLNSLPGTDYYYRIKGIDKNGHIVESKEGIITTTGEKPNFKIKSFDVTRSRLLVAIEDNGKADISSSLLKGKNNNIPECPMIEGNKFSTDYDINENEIYTFQINAHRFKNQAQSEVIVYSCWFKAPDDFDLEYEGQYNHELIHKDSDNDGLSDYAELYITNTDRDIADTDGDGKPDKEDYWGISDEKIYSFPRLIKISDEQMIAYYLREEMRERKFSVNEKEWNKIFNAYLYGEYPIESIEAYAKGCGKAINFDESWQIWKTKFNIEISC